jgi:hypothetical protein
MVPPPPPMQLLCPAGKYSPGGPAGCLPCPAGFYSSAPGAAACTPCPAGVYGSTLGLSSPNCTGLCRDPRSCPPGSITPLPVAMLSPSPSPSPADSSLVPAPGGVLRSSPSPSPAPLSVSLWVAGTGSGRPPPQLASSPVTVVAFVGLGSSVHSGRMPPNSTITWGVRQVLGPGVEGPNVAAALLGGRGGVDVMQVYVPPNAMAPGVTYRFRVDVGARVGVSPVNITASATLDVSTVGCPSQGVVTVSPGTGVAGVTRSVRAWMPLWGLGFGEGRCTSVECHGCPAPLVSGYWYGVPL